MPNSITEKIKMAIKISGKKQVDLASYLGMSKQALNNKFSRGSFSAEDLIKISEFAGCTLNMEFNKTMKILFSPDDIREE